MSMIKLCAFDLDGTLLAPDGTMSKRTADALVCLSESGIVPALISGRSPVYVGAFLLYAGVRGYVAGSNGSYITSPDGQVIYQNPFPPELAAAITSKLSARGSVFAVQTADSILGNRSMNSALNSRFSAYCRMASELGLKIGLPQSDPTIGGTMMSGILKIAVTHDPQGISSCLEELSAAFPEISVSLSGPTVGDINLNGDSKGSALIRIAEDLGVSSDEICSMGDYDNDLSMFRESGVSVAMGNSTPAVLDAAGYITSTNAEDGVADAIMHILLSRSNDN
ncbi:MAG: HAD family hydrolase [Oscillospiraceae bacterium]|nr:HAD family hydrolase [Oscillospiraceae bacterium]